MKKEPLKDQLFNPQKVNYLASLIQNVYPAFKGQLFSLKIIKQFPKLELKQRITCIQETLAQHLPNDFDKAMDIILAALPKELDADKTDNDFGDFIFAPLADFVAKNGLQDQYLTRSFDALAQITKRFSAEMAIRFFINAYPKQSFAFMKNMARSDNYHQRRLASEGLRPKLPWCIAINFDYKKSIEILNVLYFDKTRFVVRSVANHLNDIAKIDADLVIKTLQKWQLQGRQNNQQEFDFLTRHALRTLIKQGNTSALKLLGYLPNPAISIEHFKIVNKSIRLGDYLRFSFTIKAQQTTKLMIDYKIIYPTKTNKQSAKVFKIRSINLSKNQPISIEKQHLFKPMTTKKLYSGSHQMYLQINGKVFTQDDFFLKTT